MNLYFLETNEQVGLPCGLVDFRGVEWYVLNVEEPASEGKSGRVRASTPGTTDSRTFYPDVFRCYIADKPRSLTQEQAADLGGYA